MTEDKQGAAVAASPVRPRVFMVEVSFTVPVQAESAEEAEQFAEEEYAASEWREGGGQFSAEYQAWEVREPLPKDLAHCLPWGGDGETTIGDLLGTAPKAPTEAVNAADPEAP